jgi:type I restriction enzyme, S subunit
MSASYARPPADWQVKPLKEIADVIVSNVDKKTIAGETPVRLCNYTDVYKNNDITSAMSFMEASANPAEINSFAIRRGDVIITKDSETPDDIGVPAVVRDDIPRVLCGYHLSIVRPKSSDVDSVYLARQIASPRIARYFGQQANGTTRYGLNIKPVESTAIWLAPLTEQRRIAEILDTADAAIQKTVALIAKLKQMKAGLLHDLLTRGIDENGELREKHCKKQPLTVGHVPFSWEIKRCDELCHEIVVGIVVRPVQYYTDRGVPVLRSANIKPNGIDPSDLVFMSDENNERMSKSMVRAGDVVTVRTGYPGTSCVVSEEFDRSNCVDILISRPTKEVRSDFLAIWINSDFGKGQVLRQQSGLAQQHFNVGELKELRVAKPSLDEQDRIVACLKHAQDRIDREFQVWEKFRLLKAGLMHDLLTGEKRVNQPALVAT